jgi:hypothetical protein
VKARLNGATPRVGLTESAKAVGGEISCVSSGISADIPRKVRPPEPPLSEEDELLTPAAASGMVPVVSVPVAEDPVDVADGSVMCLDVRGKAVATFLGGVNDSLV